MTRLGFPGSGPWDRFHCARSSPEGAPGTDPRGRKGGGQDGAGGEIQLPRSPKGFRQPHEGLLIWDDLSELSQVRAMDSRPCALQGSITGRQREGACACARQVSSGKAVPRGLMTKGYSGHFQHLGSVLPPSGALSHSSRRPLFPAALLFPVRLYLTGNCNCPQVCCIWTICIILQLCKIFVTWLLNSQTVGIPKQAFRDGL